MIARVCLSSRGTCGQPCRGRTVITPRRHLYDHPRVEPVFIRDADAVAAALAQRADGIVHVRSWRSP
jgi:hypothetical protein